MGNKNRGKKKNKENRIKEKKINKTKNMDLEIYLQKRDVLQFVLNTVMYILILSLEILLIIYYSTNVNVFNIVVVSVLILLQTCCLSVQSVNDLKKRKSKVLDNISKSFLYACFSMVNMFVCSFLNVYLKWCLFGVCILETVLFVVFNSINFKTVAKVFWYVNFYTLVVLLLLVVVNGL